MQKKMYSNSRDALVIVLVGLAHSVSHFFHMILPPLFPWLKQEFALSYAELGLLMTVFFVVSGVGQALAGFVVDKVGARPVLFFGLTSLAASGMVLSIAPNYLALLAGAMLAGLGNSVFHPADYTILNRCVSSARMAYAFSVHGVTGNLGWAAAPVFLVGLAQWLDWRRAVFYASIIPVLVLALLYVYRAALNDDVTEKHSTRPAQTESMLAFMKLPAIWMCIGFFFLISLALGAIQSFSALALRELYGMSLSLATSAYTMFMLASAAGMLWGGWLAARANNHARTIALAFSAAAVLALVVASASVNPSIALFLMAGIGFGSGVAGPSRDLLIRAAAPKHATGRVYGVVYSGLDSGLACAPLLFGALMDYHRPAWIFVGVAAFQFLAILTALDVAQRSRRFALCNS